MEKILMETFRRILAREGYECIQGNPREIIICAKKMKHKLHFVVLIDDSGGILASEKVFHNIMASVRHYFYKQGYSQTDGLAVIYTQDVQRTVSACGQGDAFWIIDTVTQQRMVFDQQPDSFFGVEILVENSLNDNYRRLVLRKKNIRYISPINTCIILLNIMYFLYIIIWGSYSDQLFMYEHGALWVKGFWEHPQFYRLITSAFMHFGWAHLFNNMVVLAYMGDNLERQLGKTKYLLFYIMCCIGSNLFSLGWYWIQGNGNVLTVGASGAIFGVVGGLTYIVIRNKGRVEDISSTQILILIGLTVYNGISNGMTGGGVNNSAHVGGFITGFLLCIPMYALQQYYLKHKAKVL